MAALSIHNLDAAVKERLRVRAAKHGRSMEAEARRILRTALGAEAARSERNVFRRIHARFAALGGLDVETPPREPACEPPAFD